jgi:hypothetical protein
MVPRREERDIWETPEKAADSLLLEDSSVV